MPGTRKLGRPTDHRRAMLRAMVTYLLENGKDRDHRYSRQRGETSGRKDDHFGQEDTLAA